MPDRKPERAVVDRIVDGVTAVLLVGDDEAEHHVDVTQLPEGATEGSRLLVHVDDGTVGIVGVDESATEDAPERAELDERMARLRARRSGDRFGRDR